jgi:hypothetical protein
MAVLSEVKRSFICYDSVVGESSNNVLVSHQATARLISTRLTLRAGKSGRQWPKRQQYYLPYYLSLFDSTASRFTTHKLDNFTKKNLQHIEGQFVFFKIKKKIKLLLS